jgi:hypothetical protein
VAVEMKAENQREEQRNSNLPELPKISITWDRFWKDPAANFESALKKPTACIVYGGKAEGKSSLVENISNRYSVVLDAFGSRDNEALAWCRSPRQDSVLFLKGESVEIDSRWKAVNTKDVTLKQISTYKAIISCSAFYSDIREEWYSLTLLMNKLWNRTNWTDPWVLTIREAANLLYSRISIGESQVQAKNYMIYAIREMRHCGFALALDSIRWFSIDVDVRSIADYTFLKAQGIEGLPDNLHFLYTFFEPYGVMRMGVDKFIIISRKGPIGHGTSTLPYWHKRESENLLNLFDIKPSYSEKPDLGEKGESHVGDYEHVRIVQARFESHDGMEKLAERIGRSSRTVHKHIIYHNHAIETQGECDKCVRVKSLLSKQPLS